jgi:hypothetical protein
MPKRLAVTILLLPTLGRAQPAPSPTPEPPPTAADAPPATAPEPPPPPAADPLADCRARHHDLAERASKIQDLKERARVLQSMPDCAHPESMPPASEPIDVATPTLSTSLAGNMGFALEIHLETAQLVIGNNSTLPATQAGVFLGHRGPGLTYGVGFEFGRVGQSSDSGSTSSGSSATSVLVMPGIRVPIAQVADGRTELLGQVDAGYGASWTSSDAGMDPPSVQHLRAQLGLGLRHWVTPAFAIGATSGLRYDRFSESMDAGGTTSSQAATNTALITSLQMTGVF